MKHFALLIASLSCFSLEAQVVDTANYRVPNAVEKRTPSDTIKQLTPIGRKLISKIEPGQIHANANSKICMKLIVDEEGNVLEVTSLSRTVCSEPLVLQHVLDIMRSAKFNAKPGTPREVVFYTVVIDATDS